MSRANPARQTGWLITRSGPTIFMQWTGPGETGAWVRRGSQLEPWEIGVGGEGGERATRWRRCDAKREAMRMAAEGKSC